jgi:hypothetical protein
MAIRKLSPPGLQHWTSNLATITTYELPTDIPITLYICASSVARLRTPEDIEAAKFTFFTAAAAQLMIARYSGGISSTDRSG